ncbi:MAG: Tex family protein [Desulfobacterium sp.]|nr:Tex family protein [Desulfobacterium sp.]
MITTVAQDLGLSPDQVQTIADFLDGGATIPFIARYRKERTGSLDEVVIADIRDRITKFKELSARKQAIVTSLEQRDLLTDSLNKAIDRAETRAELEDLYEKFRPKKRTKAQTAREQGLEPLAMELLKQGDRDPEIEARPFVDKGKGIETVEQALNGARDILAEIFNEDPAIRGKVRRLFESKATLSSRMKKGKEDEGAKFRDYFDWSESAAKSPSHRILAMFRGEALSFLTVHVLPEEEKALAIIEQRVVKNTTRSALEVKAAVKDSYKRLMGKSLEKETMANLKQRADQESIQVFAENIRELLLFPPLGQKKVLAIDPGFRTGCKIVCLDRQGTLVYHGVIYPFSDPDKAAKTLEGLIKRYKIEAIAIGNGTAGRETEAFVRKSGLDQKAQTIMVDESGASIYSASEIARAEFPDQDITVRGAVSIGRRLMDPLAELVKIDPKSIGVGQYQHDVDQKELQKALDDVISTCVNRVGVEVNTASAALLAHVAGLNPTIAANIVNYRNENGPFSTRRELLKVPRLGPKAFEQSAGFLRISDGKNPLDRSGIHPESYAIVESMAKDSGHTVEALMGAESLVKSIDLSPYIVTGTTGMETLKDIAAEIIRPGRDPREIFKPFEFDDTIHEIKDLVPGMRVPGLVTNVTAFGAFVDIGVHQDGLVHISQLADRYIKDPNEVVKVRQQVTVTVLEVDIQRKRISLSMRNS